MYINNWYGKLSSDLNNESILIILKFVLFYTSLRSSQVSSAISNPEKCSNKYQYFSFTSGGNLQIWIFKSGFLRENKEEKIIFIAWTIVPKHRVQTRAEQSETVCPKAEPS